MAMMGEEDSYIGKRGLASLETTLGLPGCGDEASRIAAIVTEIERRVSSWEKVTPKALMRDKAVIDAIFCAGEQAEMFAFAHNGHLPDCWYGRLLYRMGPDLWRRFTRQMSRDTNARVARLASAEERRMGGLARASKDPKQQAKADARRLWQERQEGRHPKLRTNAQFANECLDRWHVLTSQKVILRWCAEWNKEARRKSHFAS